MSELDNLLKELQGLKAEATSKIENNKETWSLISKGNWEDLGFKSQEEMKQWIENNPYHNM